MAASAPPLIQRIWFGDGAAYPGYASMGGVRSSLQTELASTPPHPEGLTPESTSIVKQKTASQELGSTCQDNLTTLRSVAMANGTIATVAEAGSARVECRLMAAWDVVTFSASALRQEFSCAGVLNSSFAVSSWVRRTFDDQL